MTGYTLKWGCGIVVVLLLLAGCAAQSPRVDFYVLSADARPAGVAGNCSGQAISVGPVSWPRYLDQPRIVTRVGTNRLEASEFNRWGGSLEDDFSRTVIRNISNVLRSELILSYRNSRRFTPAYRVEMNVQQFDGRPGADITLDVKWSIVTAASGKLEMVTTSTIQQATSGPGYDALVNASSLAIAQLSEEIAAQLASICAEGRSSL